MKLRLLNLKWRCSCSLVALPLPSRTLSKHRLSEGITPIHSFLSCGFFNTFFPNHLKILLERRRTAPKSLWHHLLLPWHTPTTCCAGERTTVVSTWRPPSVPSNNFIQMFPSCWGYSSCWLPVVGLSSAILHLLWRVPDWNWGIYKWKNCRKGMC